MVDQPVERKSFKLGCRGPALARRGWVWRGDERPVDVEVDGTVEWYDGASEMYDGAADRIEAVSKSEELRARDRGA